MYITEDKFYGYDLILDQKILFLDNPFLKVRKINNNPDLDGMVNICRMEVGKNKGLGCYLNGKLEGYCEYFL